MQETEFIEQNKLKWLEFEELLGRKNKDPDRITNLFIETTDDLSYSRTYYGNRSIRAYLNGVAQQVYQTIYRNKSGGKNRWTEFWINDLPESLWHSRYAILQSFLVFIGGLFIGVVSSLYYPDFARVVLGDGYVAMTEANIQSGDPMAVYADSEPLEMFFQIALNNIRVGFMAFLLGITFAIGTYYILLFNGIMVGAFIYFFIERDLFRDAFLAIMLHGTLELSMIVLSGSAGLVLARGLLFPGTYARMQALIHSARTGIKIMLAVSLFLVYAAIIESFATRFTSLPGVPNGDTILDIARLLVILVSLGIVVGYFVIYPAIRNKRGLVNAPGMEELPPAPSGLVNTERIKSTGTIFTESFILLGRFIRPVAIVSATIAIAFTLAFASFTGGDMESIFDARETSYGEFNPLGPLWVWDFFSYHFDFGRFPLAFPSIVVLFSLWLLVVSNVFAREISGNKQTAQLRRWLYALTISILLALPLLLPQWGTILMSWIWFPLCFFIFMAGLHSDNLRPWNLSGSMRLLKGGFWKMTGVFILLLSIQWLMLMSLYSEFAWILLDFIQMNLSRFSWLATQLPYMLYTFLIAFIPLLIFSLDVFAFGLFVHSQKEINEANHLRSAISEMGRKPRAYGLEQES